MVISTTGAISSIYYDIRNSFAYTLDLSSYFTTSSVPAICSTLSQYLYYSIAFSNGSSVDNSVFYVTGMSTMNILTSNTTYLGA